MKSLFFNRLITVLITLILGSTALSAQKITNWTVSYDNDFNAVVKVTVKNTSNKTVTAIKFHVGSRDKFLHANNSNARESISRKYTCTILPNGSSTFNIPVKLKEDYVVSGIFIETVRFSDGSIR